MDQAITADEKRWRAESDAHTLAEADIIRNDKERLEAATEAAKKMAEEQLQRAASMKHVASLYTSMQGG